MNISLLPEKKDLPPPSPRRKITKRDLQLVFILLLVVALVVTGGLLLLRSQFLGYEPGSRDPGALRALAVVYAAVPCALKLAAIGALAVFARGERADAARPAP